VLFKLNAGVLQQVDRVLCVHVLRQVELEVELPRGRAGLWELALVVKEGEPKLDDLEQIDVAT
jgi:hypothetical protein